jgi:hypothetical protein
LLRGEGASQFEALDKNFAEVHEPVAHRHDRMHDVLDPDDGCDSGMDLPDRQSSRRLDHPPTGVERLVTAKRPLRP